jgi:hypothetical protein
LAGDDVGEHAAHAVLEERCGAQLGHGRNAGIQHLKLPVVLAQQLGHADRRKPVLAFVPVDDL